MHSYVNNSLTDVMQNILLSDNEYELLSDEDMEEYFNDLEDSNNK